MTKIILLVLLCVPCTALAASQCRIIEHPDYFEATCIGDTQTTSAEGIPLEGIPVEGIATLSQTTEIPQIGWEQVATIGQLSDPELPDLPPEQIVRNDLARLHGDYWLKTQGR